MHNNRFNSRLHAKKKDSRYSVGELNTTSKKHLSVTGKGLTSLPIPTSRLVI
jgi:hypothetical protein